MVKWGKEAINPNSSSSPYYDKFNQMIALNWIKIKIDTYSS